jgi:hypothetical protein
VHGENERKSTITREFVREGLPLITFVDQIIAPRSVRGVEEPPRSEVERQGCGLGQQEGDHTHGMIFPTLYLPI